MPCSLNVVVALSKQKPATWVVICNDPSGVAIGITKIPSQNNKNISPATGITKIVKMFLRVYRYVCECGSSNELITGIYRRAGQRCFGISALISRTQV